MTEDEYRKAEDRLEREFRSLIDWHETFRRLPDLARRNMAYCAAGAAMSALTAGELESI